MADPDVSTKLFDAVKAGDQSRLQDLLRDKATLSILDERDAEGFTALHHAAIQNGRIAELLLAAGADARAKTPAGMNLQDLRALGGLRPDDLLGPQALELLRLQKHQEETARWWQATQNNGATDSEETYIRQGRATSNKASDDHSIPKRPGGTDDAEGVRARASSEARADDGEGEGVIKAGRGSTQKPAGEMPRTLLGGLYVGNDAGEYTRVGQSKVALIDAGAQITLKNRDMDTFRAGIELAKIKGWTSIEVGGSPRYRQASWLEGRLEGLEVQGYEPTAKDLAALEQRLADQAQQKSIEEGRPDVVAKSLDDAKGKAMTFKKDLVAPNLLSGSYSGRVLAATSHHVLVTVDGRANTATVIERALLKDVKYREGELLNVQFKNGEVVPGRAQGHGARAKR